MERRVLRRAADEALVTSLGRRPVDGTPDGRGAADQDFEYRWVDSDDTVAYHPEPVTEPIPVVEASVAIPSEPVDVYDLVPDQPAESVPFGPVDASEVFQDEPDDYGWDDDHDEVPPEPAEAPPLRARPLAARGIAESIVATPMPVHKPQPWYRTKQAATVLAAAVIVAVVCGGWLVLRGPTTTAERSTTEAPTSVSPSPSKIQPTAVSAPQPPPAPPPPPPPPPPAAAPTYSAPQRQYSEPWRSAPTQAQKPEVGITRTPATRAPISVAPVPRPVEGSDSNTPGDAPGERPRRRGCFGFC